MTTIDKAIDALGRISLLAQLRDKVVFARSMSTKRCGACEHWMKSRECPREYNKNGWQKGPSCGDLACSKFERTASDLSIQQKRYDDAVAFAREYGLPIPEEAFLLVRGETS
jgi:hypothetical protein